MKVNKKRKTTSMWFRTDGHTYAYEMPERQFNKLVAEAKIGDPKVVLRFAAVITRGNYAHSMCCAHQLEHSLDDLSH